MDIILGKPRRRWSAEDKQAIVAETLKPGATARRRPASRHERKPAVRLAATAVREARRCARRRRRDGGAVDSALAAAVVKALVKR